MAALVAVEVVRRLGMGQELQIRVMLVVGMVLETMLVVAAVVLAVSAAIILVTMAEREEAA